MDRSAKLNVFFAVGLAFALVIATLVVGWSVRLINGVRPVDGTGDPMLSQPCRKGAGCLHHWSLTSRLGHILEDYEKALGARSRAFRILGIEFTTSRRPGIWYPDFGSGPQSVIVQLTRSARHNRDLALFQLGHEAFHLIEPVAPGQKSSVFEEGLASFFAVAYLEKIGVRKDAQWIAGENYRLAYDLVVRLANLHDDFYPRLKRFRAQHRSFSRISAGDIRGAFPQVPTTIAQQLARRFESTKAQL